ncbi:MAG: response regulator [Promethearchaeota archaeon]|nr:MAG: response regulator [Candidatus Lokiarchaeota archaeon]
MPKLVVVVDDNPEILSFLKIILEKNGYKVITSKSGNEALHILENVNKIPDLIISDIKMPEMDGYELFTKILENEDLKNIPFIFLTALNSEEQVLKGKSLGVDDYLTKPIKKKDLLAVMKGKLKRATFTSKPISISEDLNIELDDIALNLQDKPQTLLFLMKWSEDYGARLQFLFPKNLGSSEVQNLGQRLMQTAMSLRNREKDSEKLPIQGGVSVDLKSLHQKAYIYFDTIQNNDIYMMAVVTPKLNYNNILELKKTFKKMFLKMKQSKTFTVESYWKRIFYILNTT